MRVNVQSRDLARLARDLRNLPDGPKIRRRMVAEMRREAQPVAIAVRSAYLSGPSHQSGPSHLRAALAKAVTIQVKASGRDAGLRIRVAGKKMPDGMGSLPKRYEGTGRWRHPTFGRDPWVGQDARPTFYKTVRLFVPRVVTGVERVYAQYERLVSGKRVA